MRGASSPHYSHIDELAAESSMKTVQIFIRVCKGRANPTDVTLFFIHFFRMIEAGGTNFVHRSTKCRLIPIVSLIGMGSVMLRCDKKFDSENE